MAVADPSEALNHRKFGPDVEFMPREQLKAAQFARVQQFLHKLYRENGFYRRKMEQANVTPDQIKSMDDFRALIPFSTKLELLDDQKAHPPYGLRLGSVPLSDLRMSQTTTGTSGIGQETYGLTQSDVELIARCVYTHYYWIGCQPGDVCALTFPLNTGSAGQCSIAGYQYGGLNGIPLGSYDTQNKLKFMKVFPPHHIMTAPAYLTRLMVVMQEQGLKPRTEWPDLKAITVATEAFPASWAEEVQKFFGVPLHEMYGSTQQGSYIGYSCGQGGAVRNGEHGALHLMEYWTLWEQIDPETGRQVEPGQQGEAVITTFSREASPLLRFRTGDKVTLLPHDSCPCGRPVDCLEVGAISRYDDMIKIKASNIWPATIDNIVLTQAECDEYNARVIVDEAGRERVLVKIAFKKECADSALKASLLEQMTIAIKRATDVTMELEEVPFDGVERFEWKPRRWTDERRKGLETVKYIAR